MEDQVQLMSFTSVLMVISPVKELNIFIMTSLVHTIVINQTIPVFGR